jgi:hypothetical protein
MAVEKDSTTLHSSNPNAMSHVLGVLMGLITTRVKTSQRMFVVGLDLGTDGSPTWREPAKPLQKDRWYAGNLLDAEVGGTQYVGVVEWRRFKGDELEEVPGDHRLINLRIGND